MTQWQLFRKNLWLNIRRAPRDLRSFKLVGYLLYLLAYGTYLVWTVFEYGFWMAFSVGIMLAVAFGVAIFIARSHRRTDEAMLSLAPVRQSITIPDPQAHHLEAVRRLLLKRAIFADRACVEAMLRNNLLPPNSAGLGRRRTIDFARSSAVWEELAAEERELLMAPEGNWTEQSANTFSLWAEDVRTLRWVLCLDAVLTPFEFATLDFAPVLELTHGQVEAGQKLLVSWDIRPARDDAQRVLMRGFAECASRGLVDVERLDEDRR